MRLATLRRINRGSDDPSGAIAAETLRSELTALERTSAVTERARALVRVADSGLAEANALLHRIRGNVVSAANSIVSSEERAALQLETDAALEALDRIGQTASFGGRRLLDGELSIQIGDHPGEATTLPHVSSSSLGTEDGRLADLRSGGDASLAAGDLSRSLEIVDGAQDQLLAARAGLGAFERYSIDSTQAVLSRAIENITGAIGRIVDADVALETANLNRSLVLVDAALASVRLANISPSLAGQLLGGLGVPR
jgi:flagellin